MPNHTYSPFDIELLNEATNSNRRSASIDGLGKRTTYSYYLDGRLVSQMDARGNVITFAYDNANRQVAITNEIGKITTTAYDAANRISTILDANLWLKTHVYDAAGHLGTILYGDGAVTYAYDSNGRRTTMVDSTGTTTYAYDNRGSMIRSTMPGLLSVNYEYDSVENRSLMVDPDGGRVTYSYDALNRLTTFQSSDGIFTMQYNADSRMTTLIDEIGRCELCSYDSNGRLITQLYLTSASAAYATIVDTWDADGRKTKQVVDGTATTYSYDNANRLTGQQVAGGYATFTYDDVGNTTVNPQTMVYDQADLCTSEPGTTGQTKPDGKRQILYGHGKEPIVTHTVLQDILPIIRELTLLHHLTFPAGPSDARRNGTVLL